MDFLRNVARRGLYVLGAIVAGGLFLQSVMATGGFDPNNACVGNSRLISLAYQMYVVDYDDAFPNSMTPTGIATELGPYMSKPGELTCPATGKRYKPNAALAGVLLGSISNPDGTSVFQDSVPHADGLFTVTYVNGSVYRGGVLQGDKNALCENNLRMLGLGIAMYTQDYDGTLPPTPNEPTFKTAVYPYVNSSRVFICPATNQHYRVNGAISEKVLSSISNPSTVFSLTDAVAHPDGLFTTLFLDDHVTHGDTTVSPTRTCDSDVWELMQGVFDYEFDNDGYLPRMNNYAAFESEILPYVKDPTLFVCPDTGLPYVLNASLNGLRASDIADADDTVFMQDAAINKDGSFTTGYVDNQVSQALYSIPVGVSKAPSDFTDLLWGNAPGLATMWSLSPVGDQVGSITAGPARQLWAVSSVPAVIGTASNATGMTGVLFGTAGTVNAGTGTASLIQSWTSPSEVDYGPFDGWTPVGVAVGPTGLSRLLWTYYDGSAAVWLTNENGTYASDVRVGPIAGMTAVGLAYTPAIGSVVLWSGSDGSSELTYVSDTSVTNSFTFSPISGYTPQSVFYDAAGQACILLGASDGSAAILVTSSVGAVVRQLNLPSAAGWQVISACANVDGNIRVLWKYPLSASARVTIINKQTGAVVATNDYPTF
jgi:hypothetical protein